MRLLTLNLPAKNTNHPQKCNSYHSLRAHTIIWFECAHNEPIFSHFSVGKIAACNPNQKRRLARCTHSRVMCSARCIKAAAGCLSVMLGRTKYNNTYQSVCVCVSADIIRGKYFLFGLPCGRTCLPLARKTHTQHLCNKEFLSFGAGKKYLWVFCASKMLHHCFV